VLIVGNNGTGKTSVLEALHYVCYLRSFRTYSPKDLIQFDQDAFFIKLTFKNDAIDALNHELKVGFSSKKRLVKIDEKPIASYKELLDYYRVVTITEDDLELIKGGPDYRRTFIDQALFLIDQAYVELLKKYKSIVHNRNVLLQQKRVDKQSYELWSEQLFEVSACIARKRIAWIRALEKEVAQLLCRYVDPALSVQITYVSKKNACSMTYASFMHNNPELYEQEQRFRRSLFGVHLDDIQIQFQGKKSRQFASRGQQKLVALLIKVAQIQDMKNLRGATLFLLDDFMTDFDEEKIAQLIPLLSGLGCQLIFTCPSRGSTLEGVLSNHESRVVELTHSNA